MGRGSKKSSSSTAAARAKRAASQPQRSKPRAPRGSANSGVLSSLNMVQLSLLNSGLLPLPDEASAFIPTRPIELARFPKHITLFKKYDVLLKTEFLLATKGEAHCMRHASKPANDAKNTYKKLLPYDYNRVVLDTLPDIPDSDYVNATHIDSILKPNAYIAAQGPNEDTISDFWRMVWEKKCYVVVMLTKVFDFIRVMCCQYWPMELDKPEKYGLIEVTLLSEDTMANFVIRTLRLRRGEEERDVFQLHFTSWASHTEPFTNALLDFRRRVRTFTDRWSAIGPTVVHCSDGCGRTGTYMCIDANLELADEDGVYDVFGYTKKLRAARKGMVETVVSLGHGLCPADVPLVYDVRKALKPRGPSSPQYQIHAVTGPGTHIAKYICCQRRSLELVTLRGTHFKRQRHSFFLRQRDLVRTTLCIPRVMRKTSFFFFFFLIGYSEAITISHSLLHFVITKVGCNEIADIAKIPVDLVITALDSIGNCSRPFFSSATVYVTKTPQLRVRAASLICIVQGLVADYGALSGVDDAVQIFHRSPWATAHRTEKKEEERVSTLSCVDSCRYRNGKCRAGVYCAANVAIEQVVEHGEVDVFQAVKTVRRHRPQLVENMTEYKYCYDLIQHYVLHYLNKE
ncbi:unnamed protein product [Ixodes persulcatus]